MWCFIYVNRLSKCDARILNKIIEGTKSCYLYENTPMNSACRFQKTYIDLSEELTHK